jgi:predicted peptidase
MLQIASPGFLRWRQLPRPGAAGIDYLASEYFQENAPRCLASGYAGYLPKHYSQTQPWPLVVFLHGSGERGNDPQIVLERNRYLLPPDFIESSAVMLIPQCLKRATWQPEEVVRFVDYACTHYRIDRERIYLMGYSMGGYGAWQAAGAYPDLFAAIVPIAGGGNREDATRLRRTPIWAFHGTADKTVPVEQTTTMIDAIREVGGAPKLTLLPDAGHGIPEEVCKMPELWQWLFQHRRNHAELP